MGEVTREDAIRFCNAAMRNWQYVSFDEDELEDLRVELQRRLTTAQAEIEALKKRAKQAEDGWTDTVNELAALRTRVAELEAQVAADRDTFRDADILDDPIGAAAQLEAGYRNCCAALSGSQT